MKFTTAISVVLMMVCINMQSAFGRRNLRSLREGHVIYFSNPCTNDVSVKVGDHHHHSKTINAGTCEVFNNNSYYDGVPVQQIGNGATSNALSCSDTKIDQCNLRGMAVNACVVVLDVCDPTPTPTNQQCGRECSSNYECANDGGVWDEGQPWCGECNTSKGRCEPNYENCTKDSDCNGDTNLAVCGPHKYCVGKPTPEIITD